MRVALVQPPTNYVHASCQLEPIGLGYGLSSAVPTSWGHSNMPSTTPLSA